MIDIIKDYASQRIELLKMEATEKSTLTVGLLGVVFLILVFGLFFLVLFNIGIGIFIGYYVDNVAYGILIVAGFYLMLLLLVLWCRNPIKNWVANKLIKTLNQ